MKLIRRGKRICLSDGDVDILSLTPLGAEWFSQELKRLVTSEFCVQLHLAAIDAEHDSFDTPTVQEYVLKRGLNP